MVRVGVIPDGLGYRDGEGQADLSGSVSVIHHEFDQPSAGERFAQSLFKSGHSNLYLPLMYWFKYRPCDAALISSW